MFATLKQWPMSSCTALFAEAAPLACAHAHAGAAKQLAPHRVSPAPARHAQHHQPRPCALEQQPHHHARQQTCVPQAALAGSHLPDDGHHGSHKVRPCSHSPAWMQPVHQTDGAKQIQLPGVAGHAGAVPRLRPKGWGALRTDPTDPPTTSTATTLPLLQSVDQRRCLVTVSYVTLLFL